MSLLLDTQQLSYEVVASRQGILATGVIVNQSYITTSDIFYDAIFVGSLTSTASNTSSQALFVPDEFIGEAWSHGKAIAAIGSGRLALKSAGFSADNTMGIFAGDAATVTA